MLLIDDKYGSTWSPTNVRMVIFERILRMENKWILPISLTDI
jgi:hypothetical protein